MNLHDFKNKKVLIMGLGLHGGGVGAARFFAKIGSRVTVTDLKTRRELLPSLEKLRGLRTIRYRLGGHKNGDFKNADFVIKNPGVPDSSPYLALAKKSNVPVRSDIEIFFLYCPAFIAAVTGTKGKSTTTWLLGKFLEASGRKVWIGGNIRRSVLEFLLKVKRTDVVVLELSSFQLDSLANSKTSPHLAAITNVFPDHLNRYFSMRSYASSKKSIFRFQTRRDFLVINAADPVLRRLAAGAPSRVIRAHAETILPPFEKELRRVPAHHRANIALAIASARKLGATDGAIRRVLKHFRGMPGRMETVAEIRGVEFINDTTATNPEAGRCALLAVRARIGKRGKIHAIIGGHDKGLPVRKFTAALNRIADSVVLLPGSSTVRMGKLLQKKLPQSRAASMSEAVKKASHAAVRGDIVLLSPGAASFGLFKHEFDRGDQFIQAVRALKAERAFLKPDRGR